MKPYAEGTSEGNLPFPDLQRLRLETKHLLDEATGIFLGDRKHINLKRPKSSKTTTVLKLSL